MRFKRFELVSLPVVPYPFDASFSPEQFWTFAGAGFNSTPQVLFAADHLSKIEEQRLAEQADPGVHNHLLQHGPHDVVVKVPKETYYFHRTPLQKHRLAGANIGDLCARLSIEELLAISEKMQLMGQGKDQMQYVKSDFAHRSIHLPGYAKQPKTKKAKTRAQRLAWNSEHRDLNNKYRRVFGKIDVPRAEQGALFRAGKLNLDIDDLELKNDLGRNSPVNRGKAPKKQRGPEYAHVQKKAVTVAE